MSGNGGFGRLYKMLGYTPSKLVSSDGFLELICGRLYADPDRLAQLFWYGSPLPMGYDLSAVAKDRRSLDGPPTVLMPERADGGFLLGLPRTLVRMWLARGKYKDLERTAKERMELEILPAWKTWIQTERTRDLSTLSDNAVVEVLRERITRVLDDFVADSLIPGFFGGAALDRITTTLSTVLGELEGQQLARTLCMPLPGDTTFEQDALLHKVAHGKASMASFLEVFGHRTTGEMELMEPRWREDQKFLDTMCQQMVTGGRDPERIHHDNVHKREEADANLGKLLAANAASCLEDDLRADLIQARALLPWREAGKHYLMMGYETIRLAIMELSRRWDIGNDIFFLHLEELTHFAAHRTEALASVAQRKIRWHSAQHLDLADIIDSENLETLGTLQIQTGGCEFTGDAIASGISSGPARIVFDPKQAGELGTGYILVCPSTDPGWTPLFMNCRGVIVERGGVLSHGAIVARDFGIPAISLPGATDLIPPGHTVHLDGNTGRVIISEPSEGSAA